MGTSRSRWWQRAPGILGSSREKSHARGDCERRKEKERERTHDALFAGQTPVDVDVHGWGAVEQTIGVL